MGFIVPGRNNTKLLSNKSNVIVNESNILKALHYDQKAFRYRKKQSETQHRLVKNKNILDIHLDILKKIFLHLDISDINNLPLFLKSQFNDIFAHDSYWRFIFINIKLNEGNPTFFIQLYENERYIEEYLTAILNGKCHRTLSLSNINTFSSNVRLNEKNTQVLIDFLDKYTDLYKANKDLRAFLWIYYPMFQVIASESGSYTDFPWLCYTLDDICLTMFTNKNFKNFGDIVQLGLDMSNNMELMKSNNSYELLDASMDNKSQFCGSFIKYIILSMVKSKRFHIYEPKLFAEFITKLIVFFSIEFLNDNVTFDINKAYDQEYDVTDDVIKKTLKDKDIWVCILRATINNNSRNEYEKEAYFGIYNFLIDKMHYKDEAGSFKIPDVMGLL